MEEIDLIELLKRVKEGKAPKEIEVGKSKYEFNNRKNRINELYGDGSFLWFIKDITVDTKIKILDKPIIEELDEIELKSFNDEAYMKLIIRNNRDKINEIIKFINNKE